MSSMIGAEVASQAFCIVEDRILSVTTRRESTPVAVIARTMQVAAYGGPALKGFVVGYRLASSAVPPWAIRVQP